MKVKINGKDIEARQEDTVLEAALRNGIDVPNLCYDPDLLPNGNCRMCICEVNGKLMTSCNTFVEENMVVETETERVVFLRKINIELLLARADESCNEKLLELKENYGVDSSRFSQATKNVRKDESSSSIVLDGSKCILCGKCVNKCQQTQNVNAICFRDRGSDLSVGTAFDATLDDTVCVNCGQCVLACPSGALSEREDISKVRDAIKDPLKHVVVQTAPAIRASVGEEFGMAAGTLVTKKLVCALKKVGFDTVFDTDFGADLTIVEEAAEFIERISSKGVLPLFTSCCPAWVKYVELFYPEFIDNLSSCKSPHQMEGAMAKTYYAKKKGIKRENIVVVSIMPCTAKKYECSRSELSVDGCADVDFVLTTREIARFMKQDGVDINDCGECEYDDPLGESSGAGAIFGATGGVMEAALRTAYEEVTGLRVTDFEFNQIRGLSGIKEGEIIMKGKTYYFAVVHGLFNAGKLMEMLKEGKKCKYHFIEVMACPGGCIGGGGQPRPTNDEIRKKRIEALYDEDRMLQYRKSHENPSIKKIYGEFLGKPLSEKSYMLLHTKYSRRKIV